jgi:type I restriction enzyme R subunit
MKPITENQIESLAIEALQNMGWGYIQGFTIAMGAEESERENFEQIILIGRLSKAVSILNPGIQVDAQIEAIKEILRIASPELITNNETFHRFLTEGIPVTKRVDGDDRDDHVRLIDFNDPDPQFPLAYFIFKDIEWGGKVEIQN